MRWALAALLTLWLGVCPAPAAQHKLDQHKLELRGTVVPPITQSVVALSAVDSPFRKQGYVFQGKFKFTDLTPGTYTVTVYHPKWGDTQKTVSVTPSFADEKGRIEIRVVLRQSNAERERSLVERNTVSVRKLAIPPEAEEQYREGREKLAKRKFEEAIEHLQKAVEISPQFMEAWNELGTIAYQTQRYEDAEKYFRRGLECDPEAFSPLVNLGGTLVSQGRFEDALPYNRRAVEMRADDALANSQMGMNYFYLRQFPEALEFLARAKKIDPAHFTQPQIFLAEIYGILGQPQHAIDELRDFLRRNPDSPRAAEVRQSISHLNQALKEDGRLEKNPRD